MCVCVCNRKINSQTINVCNWRVHRKQFVEAPNSEKKKAYTTTTERKSFGNFSGLKENFPRRWWIQKPYENQENHIYHRNLSSVAPHFFSKEKFCRGAGRCMLSFSRQLHKRIPARTPCVTDVLCNWEMNSQIIKYVCVIILGPIVFPGFPFNPPLPTWLVGLIATLRLQRCWGGLGR